MTYRIQRAATSESVTFSLSGNLDADHVTRLRELLGNETPAWVTLDLRDVTFVDRAAVSFLASAEATDIRLVNCPPYVHRWIAAEQDYRQQVPRVSDDQEPQPRTTGQRWQADADSLSQPKT